MKRFVLHSPTVDLKEFKNMVSALKPLAEHGKVLVTISEVADKAWHILPDHISPWHEYASRNPSLFNFFPHPLIAPHLPEKWIKANRDLLVAKAEILEKEGMGAYFWSYDPNMLPESFFREHPHLRGARIDHPRRGAQEEFAMCVDLEETRSMISWMMAELKKNVPCLEVYSFKTNDAGAGMCWAGALYPGPNGPDHCASREPGKRMADMVEALHAGAREGGGPIDVYIGHSNFWNNEIYSINAHLPENTCFAAMQPFGLSAGSMMGSLYPIRGLINPLSIIRSLGQYENEDKHTVFIDCRASYDRGFETAETVSRLVKLIEAGIADPVRGYFPVQDKLRALCADWVGPDHADRVAEAFINMDEALKLKALLAPRFSPIYSGVSLRYVTRPLVIKPELLSEEEEAYFLPFVFNPRLNEARMDYIDQHGGRIEADPGIRGRLNAVFAKAMQAAKVFESLNNSADAAWFKSMSDAMRILISIVRSSGNFFAAQLIRDRNKDILEGDPRVPEKKGTSTGHLDNIPFTQIMRDELDNAAELKKLLEDGGLESLCHADDAKYEDTFVLGPDIIEQLGKKIDIMRKHWLDIEDYLEPPHK